MTFDAGNLLVSAGKMGREFRLHHMATLATKLVAFHIRDGTVSDLATDDDIDNRHDTEEKHQALNDGAAVWDSEASREVPLGEEDAERDQREPGEEHDWNPDECNQADVRVSGAAAQVKRENKQPREPRGSDKRGAEKTYPVTCQQ